MPPAATVSSSTPHEPLRSPPSSSKDNDTVYRASQRVGFADDPLSPVADRDLSETDMRRISSSSSSSDHTISNTILPSASSSSSAGPFGRENRRDSDGSTGNGGISSPLEPSSAARSRGSVYQRQSSVDDGYKGWAAYGSTEHLNPANRSTESDDYSKNNLGGRDGRNEPQSGYGGERAEDGDEARQVQQNLERWAAAEKQRRKAARTSRHSFLGPPETSNSLARRLTFGRKPNGSASHHEGDSATDRDGALLRKTSTAASASSNDSLRSDSRRGSADSSQRLGAGGASPSRGSMIGAGSDGSHSLEDVPEDDADADALTMSPTRANAKGKSRALDHGDGDAASSWGKQTRRAHFGSNAQGPFADPDADNSQKRRSLKPTARRPIVTPGRAPSIRRTPANTPQIIATDVDAAAAAAAAAAQQRQSRRLSKGVGGAAASSHNPFLSASEAVQAAENGGHYRQPHETSEQDIGMPPMSRAATTDSLSSTSSTITTTPTTQQPSARWSMSSSKFREVGLDVSEGEEDEGVSPDEIARRRQLKRVITGGGGDSDDDTVGRNYSSRRRHREAEEDRQRVREGKGRQPWWTEWLCGCGRVVDDDNEQTGKTGPE